MAMVGYRTVRCTRYLTRHFHSTPTALKQGPSSHRERLAASLTLPTSITDKSKRRILEFDQIPIAGEETGRPSILRRLPDQFQPGKTSKEKARVAQEEREKERAEKEAKREERKTRRGERREKRVAMNLVRNEEEPELEPELVPELEPELEPKLEPKLEPDEAPPLFEEPTDQDEVVATGGGSERQDEVVAVGEGNELEDHEVVAIGEGNELQKGQEFQSAALLTTAEDESSGALLTTGDGSSGPPLNILGDLESLFGEEVPPSEPTVEPEEAPFVTRGEMAVDYAIYYNRITGEREVMEDAPLSRFTPGDPVPLDHVIRFLRDSKCFDCEVIQAEDHHNLEHVVITSVRNYRHLRDTSLTFSKMIVRDYGSESMRRGLGREWCYFDLGHCVVHFVLPVERARVNLESYWLGMDHELVSVDVEKSYIDGLLEGIFPDEDFTRLATPFELVRDDSDKLK